MKSHVFNSLIMIVSVLMVCGITVLTLLLQDFVDDDHVRTDVLLNRFVNGDCVRTNVGSTGLC